MSMGIERVLRENFVSSFREIIEITDDSGPTELSIKDVQQELDRLSPAIVAMGSSAEIVSVDTQLGVVTIRYRGANKVRQGLELALLDVPLVNRVEFVMGEN